MADPKKTTGRRSGSSAPEGPAIEGESVVAKQNARQFQLLVSSVTDYAICMLDATGHVRTWNVGAQRIKGYAEDEIIGHHISRFYTDEDKQAGEPQRALEAARKIGRFEREAWRVRKDGTRFWAYVIIDAIYGDSGELIGFAKITRDITERVNAQRALEKAREALHQSQKMEAIGQLTGGVAHDFNNLLTVIAGSLDLIARDDDTTQRTRRLAENALRAADRGSKLTQQLLAFSRRQALNPEVVDPNELVGEFQPMLQRACGETIQVQLDLEPGLWPANLDAAHFEAALLNLTVNSRDAMPGGGTLTIVSRNVDLSLSEVARMPDLKPGPHVRISVCDTGHGMSAEVMARAAEPFFTTKSVGRGSGLGLSQVYGFVRQSGGQMVIESEVDRGTSIHLYLPKSSEPLQRAAKPRQPSAEERGQGTVLVVEDNPDVLEITVENLRDLGYRVVTASDGVEALSILKGSSRIDVLLTDVVMPNGVNGIELARHARKMRPGLSIVLASGYAEPMLQQQGITSEFPFLAKPFRQVDLARKLRAAVSGAAIAGHRIN